MPVQIYSRNANKILQNKRRLQESLKVKLEIKSNVSTIIGKAEDEQIALRVLEAIDLGFDISDALDLKNDDFVLEIIQIKKIAKRRNLVQVRGRIIGTERKVLRTIEELTGCSIVLHDNTVGIIGELTAVEKASYALKRIIAGSNHANMYAWLELQLSRERQSF